jgi:hypothetical protein
MIAPKSVRLAVLIAAAIIGAGCGARTNDTALRTRNRHPAEAGSANLPEFIDDGPVTDPLRFDGENILLDSPDSGQTSQVTAGEAFGAFLSANPVPASELVEPLPTPHLVLASATIADYGPMSSDNVVQPYVDDRLVWVVVYSDAGIKPDSFGNPEPGASESDEVAPVTANVLGFVDAATGEVINAEVVS